MQVCSCTPGNGLGQGAVFDGGAHPGFATQRRKPTLREAPSQASSANIAQSLENEVMLDLSWKRFAKEPVAWCWLLIWGRHFIQAEFSLQEMLACSPENSNLKRSRALLPWQGESNKYNTDARTMHGCPACFEKSLTASCSHRLLRSWLSELPVSGVFWLEGPAIAVVSQQGTSACLTLFSPLGEVGDCLSSGCC